MAASFAPTESLDDIIKDTLNSLTTTFFSAIGSASLTSLLTFQESWLTFNKTVESVYDKLQDSTLSLVHYYASVIETVAGNMASIEEAANDIANKLQEEMQSLSLEEGMYDDVAPISYPAYIKPSYDWLLKNLHNPYPSVQVRNKISKESSCLRKDVDCWFIDARKRIGWNALRKTRFSNKRSDIVDAAHRFIEANPKRPLPSDVELQFATIKTLAKDLYSDKLERSPLAVKLDSAVKDMSVEIKQQIKEGRRKPRMSRRSTHLANPYPSPEHSPQGRSISISSSSSSTHSTNESFNSKKRRASSYDDTVEQPNKRARSDEDPLPPFSTGLLSPAASVEDVVEVLEHPNTPSEESLSIPEPSVSPIVENRVTVGLSAKRKRRSSEVDTPPSSKRFRTEQPTIQSQDTFSELPPIPDSFLQGTPFGALFGYDVPPVGIDQLDPANTYDINFYDYSAVNGLASNEQLMPANSTTISQSSLATRDEAQTLSIAHPAPLLDDLSSLWPHQVNSQNVLRAVSLHDTSVPDYAPVASFNNNSATSVAAIEPNVNDILFGDHSLDLLNFDMSNFNAQNLFDGAFDFSTESLVY